MNKQTEMEPCQHEPDMNRLTIVWDGDGMYIDTVCKKCGIEGCVGAVDETSPVDWDTD